MKRADVDTFEKLIAQLSSIHREVTALSRKSPNNAVNKFKLTLINATIGKCNVLLGEKYKPFAEFTLFSEDDVPSNSDVSFVVAQYLECAETFRTDHITETEFDVWMWRIDDQKRGEEGIQTAAPRRLRGT